jgi:hypothetical protein
VSDLRSTAIAPCSLAARAAWAGGVGVCKFAKSDHYVKHGGPPGDMTYFARAIDVAIRREIVVRPRCPVRAAELQQRARFFILLF